MKSKKNKKAVITAAALVILAAAVFVYMRMDTGTGEDSKPKEQGNGVVGIISDSWDPNVSQPEQEKKPGTQIPGYQSAVMKEGDTSLKIRIGNPTDNKVGFIATLKLEDGTELYTSPLLKPGQGLEEVPLAQSLKKGEYSAMVEYQCVSLEDEKTRLNKAQSGFTLIVEQK